MLHKLESIQQMLNNSPMIEIEYEYLGKTGVIYAKCEWYSLTGSIKDRVAYQIFHDAYKCGALKNGNKVVEVSSGNMGISVSAIANITGNPTTIIMPRNMSDERKKLIKLYGAKLKLVNDFSEAFKLCEKMQKHGCFCPQQFANTQNKLAHQNITGKEIADKVAGKGVKYFVSGVGTSGTLMGAGEYLKQKLGLKVIAMQPKNAQILNTNIAPKHHKIQGISDEIVPRLYDKNVVDGFVAVGDNDAIAMAKKLCKCLSLPVGISGGANFLAGVMLGEKVATVFPDDNKKYLSTDLCKVVRSKLVSQIKLKSVRYI